MGKSEDLARKEPTFTEHGFFVPINLKISISVL